MEHNAAISRNKVPSTCYNTEEPQKHATWKKPVTKSPCYVIPFTWNIHIGKPIETESRLWLPQIWGERGWGATVSGDKKQWLHDNANILGATELET